jgi:hypothetical protein
VALAAALAALLGRGRLGAGGSCRRDEDEKEAERAP